LKRVVSGAVYVRAQGDASVIDLSALQSFRGHIGGGRNSGFDAISGGTILCENLVQVVTAHITLDATGVMDTAQIVSYTGSGTLSISGIGRDFGNLSTLNGITLNAVGVVPQLESLTNIDGSSLLVSGGAELVLPQITSYTNTGGHRTLRASGVGSVLALGNVETLMGSTNWDLSIEAQSGGRVDLGSATEVVSGAVYVRAQGDASVIDLSALQSFRGHIGGGRNSGFDAISGGTILCENLVQVVTAHITLDATGVMDTAQIVSYTGSGTLSISGIGRDFGNLSTLNGITLNAVGVVPQLESLTNIDGSSLLVSGSAELVLPQITSYTNTGGHRTLRASGVGSVLALGNVETLMGSTNWDLSIEAQSGGRVDLGSATEVVSGAVYVRAQGDASVIDLSALQSFRGHIGGGRNSGFDAISGGTILCENLVQVVTAHITLDATGVMDTAQIVSYTGGGTLNASVIARDFGELTTLNGITLNAVGIVPQLGRLTNIDGSSLLASDGAVANSSYRR
jgi:hypothetical protein